MKKKVLVGILFLACLILLVVIFKENLFINYVKQFISKRFVNNNDVTLDKVTVVDVTGLATGNEVSHICENFFETKYDENNHWKECTICKKKYDVTSHSYITTGTYGCSSTVGYQYNTCSCGYSYKLEKKQHTLSQVKPYGDSLIHYSICSVCGERFYKKEWLIETIIGSNLAVCHTSEGKIIGCGNSGTCSICGRYSSASKHNIFQKIDKEINIQVNNNTTTETFNIGCLTCGFKIGTAKIIKVKTGIYTYNYTFEYTINDNNYIPNEKGKLNLDSVKNYINVSNVSATQTGNTYSLSVTVTSKNTLSPGFYNEPFLWCDGYYNGEYIGLQVIPTKERRWISFRYSYSYFIFNS